MRSWLNSELLRLIDCEYWEHGAGHSVPVPYPQNERESAVMAQTFPVSTIQEVATAAKEIIIRAKDGTLKDDVGLLNNQVTCGIIPYVSTLAAGSPVTPIGSKPLPSLEDCEKQLGEIAVKGEAAIVKAGLGDQFIKMLLRVALTAALAKLPAGPLKDQIQALINQFLS